MSSRRALVAILLALLALGVALEWTATDYRHQANLVPVTQPPAGFQVVRSRPAPARLVAAGEPRQAGDSYALPDGSLRELEQRLDVSVRVLDQSAGGLEQTIWLETVEAGTVRYCIYQVTADGWTPLRFAEVPPAAWRGSFGRGLRAGLLCWLIGMVCWLLVERIVHKTA